MKNNQETLDDLLDNKGLPEEIFHALKAEDFRPRWYRDRGGYCPYPWPADRKSDPRAGDRKAAAPGTRCWFQHGSG